MEGQFGSLYLLHMLIKIIQIIFVFQHENFREKKDTNYMTCGTSSTYCLL